MILGFQFFFEVSEKIKNFYCKFYTNGGRGHQWRRDEDCKPHRMTPFLGVTPTINFFQCRYVVPKKVGDEQKHSSFEFPLTIDKKQPR